MADGGPFEIVDCTDHGVMDQAVLRFKADTIYHLAAILSAVGEADPHRAYEVNLGGLENTLEVARIRECAVFIPSSIAAFGPTTPPDPTPQVTIQRPTTIYGVTKVAGELLADYFHLRFGVDTRGVRYPGLISWVTEPGGGTTDYAVEIFYEAIRKGSYTCFLKPDAQLDMMYMPDAIKASMDVMEADPGPADQQERLQHRRHAVHARTTGGGHSETHPGLHHRLRCGPPPAGHRRFLAQAPGRHRGPGGVGLGARTTTWTPWWKTCW